ncbi:hypothetical protein [Gordonia otitidis]|uniref:Uncharacterized protein n=1 Tax=Gordonia otitidis (strain DSM 44809 / CCUG 52243 / JCM 12355 / NBRC 100426 / IFM 10032) TaxID=1108044 RepID=H5TRR2_GORO1|nr:hypothetical protein [Gordonia otitidis]GAB36170.1 hypothetical protein GOOTI_202_00260 [Gordonia otitidis NBRC 100426]
MADTDPSVPPVWVRAVLDRTDLKTAQEDIAAEDEMRDNIPSDVLLEESVSQAARDYRNAAEGRTTLDPQLAELVRLIEYRDGINESIRLLICLLREWGDPPISLGKIAAATGMSASGVRSSYTADDRDHVHSILGLAPRGTRDPDRPQATLPNPYRPAILLGHDASSTPVLLPADASLLVDIGLDDPRRDAVQSLLAAQLAERVLPGFPTPTMEQWMRSATVFYTCVRSEPLWGYSPLQTVDWPQPDPESVPADLPRLRVVVTLDGDPTLPDTLPLWLIGHVAPIVTANPGRAYVLQPPTRSFRWQWTLTAPDGSTTDLRLAAPPDVTVGFADGDDAANPVLRDVLLHSIETQLR